MGVNATKTGGLRRIVAGAVLIVACAPWLAAGAEVRIGGTGNALGTMRLLCQAFTRLHPESRLVVLDSIGSSGALKAVAKGAIEIGLTSRPVTEAETASGLTTIEYARSPTVLAVQERNTVTSISLEQLADIYAGTLSTWPDGVPIRPVMRQPGDENTLQVKRLSTAIEAALLAAGQRPGLVFAANDQDAADDMEAVPGSIGVTTIALIRSEKRRLRPLALDGVEPTRENAQSGRYPLITRFSFVLPRDPVPAAREFIKFVNSLQGRQILERSGHLTP